MKYLSLFILLALLQFSSCDKCKDYACFTPPNSFHFQFVQSETKEDLLKNNHFDRTKIKVTEIGSDTFYPTEFIEGEDQVFLNVYQVFWHLGAHDYILEIGDERIPISIDQREINEDCCTFHDLKKFEISDYEFEKHEGHVVIFLD